MKEIIEVLNANPMGVLATVDNGKPQVRPWGFMLAEDGKLWFCTGNTKPVFQQLQKNPSVAFCTTTPEYVTVRLSGDAHFSKDMAMKKKIIEHCEIVRSNYKTPDNPIFEIFYLEHGTASLSDFSGKPPKTVSF